MLQLGTGMQTIEGIACFPDNADERQWWYLPKDVRIARRREDGHPLFSLLKFRPDPSDPIGTSGGFAVFTATVGLDDAQEQRLKAKLPGRDIRLSAVPFDEGTVQCVALNLQGPGGTTAQLAANGTFVAVQSILGGVTPSLSGGCDALFSLALTKGGVTLLEEAFSRGLAPIGVLYQLKYTALRPALDVRITADLERVYQQFSLGAKANIYWVKAAIDLGFERLVQNGVIRIEVTNFSTAADKADKEKWAVDFFKDKLLTEWFEPTLTPGSFKAPAGGGMGLPSLPGLPGQQGGAATGAATPTQTPAAGTATPKPQGSPSIPPRALGLGGTAPPEPKPGTGTPAAPPEPTAGTGTPAAPPEPKTSTGTPAAPPEPKPGTGTPAAPPEPKTSPSAPTTPADPKTGPSGPTTPADGGEGGALVTVQLKAIHQEERKKITLEYHSSEAVQRVHAPQANFGLLTADLERDDVIAEIPLADPFFKRLEVDVDVPVDFAKIGLSSVTAALDYGNPGDTSQHTHADLVFSASDHAPKRFETFLNSSHDLSYAHRIEFRFDPQSGWRGERNEYVLEPPDTTDRTLLLDPYAHLGFIEVRVFPNRIDAGAIAWTEVHLTHTEPSGWKAEDTITLAPGGEAQVWRVRTGAPDRRKYEYTLVHHLRDGTERTVGPFRSAASSLPVDDPFRSRIEPRFVLQVPPGTVESAILEVFYADDGYEREEQIEINGDQPAPARLRIATLDPKKREYTVRATLIGTDHRIVRGAPTVTDAEVVGINELAEVV